LSKSKSRKQEERLSLGVDVEDPQQEHGRECVVRRYGYGNYQLVSEVGRFYPWNESPSELR
jgi:hypothetical protein